jgi:hypothetical protein
VSFSPTRSLGEKVAAGRMRGLDMGAAAPTYAQR